MALEAQLKKLSKAGPKPPVKGKAGNDGKKAKKPFPGNRDKPTWMTVSPKVGDPHKKTVKGKPYWWCPKHKAWGRHIPAECRGQGIGNKPGSKTDEKKLKTDPGQDESKALQLSKALAALVDQDDEDSEE